MDTNKTPDLLDIAITNTNLHIKAKELLELQSTIFELEQEAPTDEKKCPGHWVIRRRGTTAV